MNLITFIIVGGFIGWLASLIMKTDRSQGIVMNIVIGIVGALVAGWLLTPMFGIPPITTESPLSGPAILISLFGAVILLAFINLVRRGGIGRSPG